MILSDPPKFQERTNPFGLIKTARRTPLKVTIFFTILIYGELSNVSDAHFLVPFALITGGGIGNMIDRIRTRSS